MNKQEFADVEPLLIIFDFKERWNHPFIEDWYKEGDMDVYRVYFKNVRTGEKLIVIFKSNYISEKCEDFFDLEEELPKQDLWESPYIDSSMVLNCLYITLIEDVWSPMPPVTTEMTMDEYFEWKGKIRPKQFCFTKFGKKVSKFFKDEVICDFFSLDCSLYKEKDGTWGFQS